MCRVTLKRLREDPRAPEILERVDPAAIAAIEGGRSLTWISTRPLDQVADVMFEVMGHEDFRDFFARQITSWNDSKLFRPLSQAAAHIFGRDPTGHLKWLGRGMQITSRNMGQIVTAETPEGVRIAYTEIPPSHRIERMAVSMEGSIRGIVQATGQTPRVAVDQSRRGQGTLTYDVTW